MINLKSKTSAILFFSFVFLVCFFGILALFFYQTNKTSYKIAGCEAQADKKQRCFQNILNNEAREHGISKAFELLSEIYAKDAEFADYCHGNTHTLGETTYYAFKQGEKISLSSKTSYCGFGFYHGFMEALLHDTGNIIEARKFCEYVDSTSKIATYGVYSCYHGIGHGAVDGSDPSLYGDDQAFIRPGLSLCNAFEDNVEHLTRCASGVFNSLVGAYFKPEYRLNVNPKDPYAVCKTLKSFPHKNACYNQMNILLDRTVGNFEDALQLIIKTSEKDFTGIAINAAASPFASRNLKDIRLASDNLNRCLALPEQYKKHCSSGFAAGLIETGKPGEEYVFAIDVCVTGKELAQSCLLTTYEHTKKRLDKETQSKACKYALSVAGKQEEEICNKIMSSK